MVETAIVADASKMLHDILMLMWISCSHFIARNMAETVNILWLILPLFVVVFMTQTSAIPGPLLAIGRHFEPFNHQLEILLFVL